MSGNPEVSATGVFGVDAYGVVVEDFDGEPSPYIIEYNDPFRIWLTLKFGGILWRWILCCLRWRVCYCFEVICYYDETGTGHPGRICSNYYDGRTDRYEYGADVKEATLVTVEAGKLRPGTYRLTAVVEFYWKCPCVPPLGRPPISAFVDGPTIQILGDGTEATGTTGAEAAPAHT